MLKLTVFIRQHPFLDSVRDERAAETHAPPTPHSFDFELEEKLSPEHLRELLCEQILLDHPHKKAEFEALKAASCARQLAAADRFCFPGIV